MGHKLKRRAAGFLRSDKIAALFTKIGKVNATTGEVCRKVQEQLQQQAEVTRYLFPYCGVLQFQSTPKPNVIKPVTLNKTNLI